MTETTDMPVLVIEDEPEIRKFLKAVLTTHDYRPLFAETGRDGLKAIAAFNPEAIILDLGLPDMDGLDVIRSVREWSAIPIIVLSARGQEQDKIAALEGGADDYLTKPFGSGELLARLKVALRHARQSAAAPSAVIESGDLVINLESRRITLLGAEIKLTPKEYKLLTMLARHAGKVVTNKQLLQEVWGKNAQDNSHYLRIYIQHLRQKLGDDPLKPRYIFTETGVGYRFRD
jgi:two-component system KDP operon response regulator KdpE